MSSTTPNSKRLPVWTGYVLLALVAAAAAIAGCGGDSSATVGGSAQGPEADHFLSGQLYVDSGNLELALEELSRAVQINPHLALAYSKMGSIYETRGQMEQACRSFERAVDLDPKSVRDLLDLGGVYQAMERLADAVRVYVQATTIEPSDYQSHFELGTLYYRLNRLAEAEVAFNECIALDDGRPEALAHIGVVYDAQGRYYDASRAYRESLERKLDQPKVMLNLATTYIKQGRFGSAVDVLKLTRGIDETDAQVHESLGFCYYRLGNEYDRKDDTRDKALRLFDLSRESYLRALELNSGNAKTLAGLGAVHMCLSLKSLDLIESERLRMAAVGSWHRSLEIEPNQPNVAGLLQKYGQQHQASEMPRP